MNSSNIEVKFGTIGFLAFIYLLFSESIKEDSVPLIIQNELKFETMLTPLFAEFSISFSPLIGSFIAVTLPLVFIILVDPNSTFGPAFAVSSFSFVRNGFQETNGSFSNGRDQFKNRIQVCSLSPPTNLSFSVMGFYYF